VRCARAGEEAVVVIGEACVVVGVEVWCRGRRGACVGQWRPVVWHAWGGLDAGVWQAGEAVWRQTARVEQAVSSAEER